MNNETQIDANVVINNLLEQIATQSKEIAILKAQLVAALIKEEQGE